jgi:signal transduction histidine kinase/CheY-like chemotaxis protein
MRDTPSPHTSPSVDEDALARREQAVAAAERALEAERIELERARADLRREAEQVATTSLYKSQFLANISHELRTPLNSMLILSKMLWDNASGNLTAKQVDYAQIIHSSGNDLLTLIDEVLDLCKMEAGTVPLDLGEVDVGNAMRAIERAMRPIAEKRGLTFTVVVEPDVPDQIHTDQARLRQMLEYLLANAIKFTERGRVELKVRTGTPAERLPQPGAVTIAFAVRDTGIGIPRDKHRAIFEAFQQADGHIGRRYGGTGLGLAVAREIARMLGGEIRLESEPGRGSTFTLLLPSRRRRRRRLEGHKVLVVDDDARNVFALGSVLEDHGLLVLRADSGPEGIAMLHQVAGIEAVLMDVMMPGMDGYEAMRTIRREPAFADLPIIAITAQAMTGDREKCIASGATDYLSKPVDIELLLARLTTLFGRRADH